MKNANRIFGHLRHVFVNCARSARQILISARQFVERYSLVVLVGPLCPGKLFWHEISQGQGQMQNLKFRKFHEILTLAAPHVRKNDQIRSLTRISMPCGAAVAISNITWLVETVLRLPSSNIALGPGRRSMKNANRNFGHLHDVFVNCARSARQILISARQFVERYSLVVLVGPLCPGKLFWHEIFVGQGLVQKFEISKISWNIHAGGPSRDRKWANSLADANFNALRRRRGHF